MSRRFAGTGGPHQVTFSAGAASGWGTTIGAITFAALWKPASVHAGGLWRARNVGASNVLVANNFSDGHIYWTSNNQFTSDAALGNYSGSTGWEIWIISRASGSTTPRFHRYRFDTGLWTHANGGAATGNSPDGAITSHIVGSFDATNYGDYSMAVAGAINATMSDAAAEAAGLETSLAHWVSTFSIVWPFNQASTSDTITDATGGGANQTAISGTSVDADEPAGFSYGGADQGEIAAILPRLTSALTGGETFTAALAGALPRPTSAWTAAVDIPGALAAALPGLVGALAGGERFVAALAGQLPAVNGTLTGVELIPANLAGTLPRVTSVIAAAVDVPGALAAPLPRLLAAVVADLSVPGVLAGPLPRLVGALVGQQPVEAALAARLPAFAAAMLGAGTAMGDLAGSVRRANLSLAGVVESIVSTLPELAGTARTRGLGGSARVV